MTWVGEEGRVKAHGDGVPAPWCEEAAEKIVSECQARGKYLGRKKWKAAELEVVEEVEALSVAEEEEEASAKCKSSTRVLLVQHPAPWSRWSPWSTLIHLGPP